jgi:hypothetical protein
MAEAWIFDTERRVGSAEVIRHYLHSAIQQWSKKNWPAPSLCLDFDLPIEIRQPPEQAGPGSRVELRIRCADEVEANTDNPDLVERQEFVLRDIRRHHSDTAEALSILLECFHQITVVRPQEARLDEHRIGHSIPVQDFDVLLGRSIVVRGVTACISEW